MLEHFSNEKMDYFVKILNGFLNVACLYNILNNIVDMPTWIAFKNKIVNFFIHRINL